MINEKESIFKKQITEYIKSRISKLEIEIRKSEKFGQNCPGHAMNLGAHDELVNLLENIESGIFEIEE